MPDIPPRVAKAFLRDMKAYFAEKDRIKADEIAARQLHALREHHTGKKPLRLTDVKRMFVEMRDSESR